MNFEYDASKYNARVKAARIMYATYIPRIDGHTGHAGLPHIFAWAPIKLLLGMN